MPIPREIEIVQANPAVFVADVRPLMPSDWADQIDEVVRDYGKYSEFRGKSLETSLEPETFITAYRVVNGEIIVGKGLLPWLVDLWGKDFCGMVSRAAESEVEPDDDKKFGININTLTIDTQKHGYETHTDANHWTALLARDTMGEQDGGELEHIVGGTILRGDNGEFKQVVGGTTFATRVKMGFLYMFNGNEHPHKVRLLKPEGHSPRRTTIPMDYIFRGQSVERSERFDVLFGNGKH